MIPESDNATHVPELEELTLLDLPVGAGDVVLGAAYGADGYQALRCAATIAWAHDRRLRIVRVIREVEWLLDERPTDVILAAAQQFGAAVLADTAAFARRVAPHLAVDLQLVQGSLIDVLAVESTRAGLLVLGVGSSGTWCDARHDATATERAEIGPWCGSIAACPVLTVDASGHVQPPRKDTS